MTTHNENDVKPNLATSKIEPPEQELQTQPVDPNTMSDLQIDEAIKKAFKQINVTQITPTLRERFSNAIVSLEGLVQELLTKQADMVEKTKAIEEKLLTLQKTGRIKIDDKDFAAASAHTKELAQNLEKMATDISRDVAYYSSLLSSTPPQYVSCMNHESDSYEEYLEKRIPVIKRYVKTARRNLEVSYSRYCFSFETQMRQLAYVEHVLKQPATPRS